MTNSFYFTAILLFFFACEKSVPQTYHIRSSPVLNPIQSDSCLLGEKILFYEDSLTSEGILVQVPVWRKDNFNAVDSLHISKINQFYSNYQINYYGESTVIIQTKKLYSSARIFTRLIEFDTNGYQKNDMTIYNYSLGEFIEYSKFKIIVLNQPIVSTAAHILSPDFAPKIVILNEDYELVKEVNESKRGSSSSFVSSELILPNSLTIIFSVVEGCYGCFDDFWSYSITIDTKGNLLNAKVLNPNIENRSSYAPTDSLLKEQEKLIWN